MERYWNGLLAAMAMLVLNFLVAGTTLAASIGSRAKDSDAIREAVFHYQIQHDIASGKILFYRDQKLNRRGKVKHRQPTETTLRFLAVSDVDSWWEVDDGFQQGRGVVYHDPSDIIINHLAKQYPFVRNYGRMASFERNYHSSHGTNVALGNGVFYWTEKLHWINHSTIEIAAGSKGNIGGTGDLGASFEDKYRVVKQGHRWVVQSVTQIAGAG